VYRMQSIRLLASDNRTMKKIAKRQGVTFNRWAVEVLMKEVHKQERANGKIQS